jgi:hypothetical protein
VLLAGLAGRLLARLPLVYATYRVAQFLVFLQANQVKKKKRQKKKSDTHNHTHTGDVIWESIERERNRKPARCVRHCLFELFFFSVIKNKMFFLASLQRQDTSADTYVLEFLIDPVGEIAFRYRNSHKQQQQQQQQLLLKKPERKEKKKKLWQKLNLKCSK